MRDDQESAEVRLTDWELLPRNSVELTDNYWRPLALKVKSDESAHKEEEA